MFLGIQLIAVSLFTIKALAVTVLTTNNCPATFDLTLYNTTSSSSSQAAVDLIYAGIYSSSDQSILEQSFSQGDTDTLKRYITNMQILFPFIIIAVAFGITYIIAICCCIFEKTCPPCQSWKRDFSKNPYDKTQLKCTSIFTVSFSFSILIVAIIGLVFYPNLQTNLAMIKCSMFYTLDIAINGDVNSNWGGFSQIATQSSNISTLLANAASAVSSNFGSSNSLTASLANFRQQNINIYNNNYQSTVRSPNHLSTSAVITPLFISTGLGPVTQANTMTYDIQSAIKVTEKVTFQGSEVFGSAQLFSNSLTNIQAKYNSSIQSMNLNSNYLSSSVASVQSFSEVAIDSIFSQFLYLIQGILGILIISSILILLGVLATHYFEIYGCKACVHLGWMFYGLMYFGVLMLTFIFFAAGGVTYSFCRFYEGIVQNQAKLDAFSMNTKPTAFNHIFQTLTPCFYGNGNISSTFSLSNQLATISKLFNDINTYLNMQDSSKSTYIDLNTSINKINAWANAMDNYKTGIYVDASPAVTTEDNPYVALKNMNTYTNNGTNSLYPTCTYDLWVFDKTNCTHSSTEAIYESNTITSGTTFVSTGFMCISFNQKFSSSSTNIWSNSDILNRYVTRRNCQNNTSTFDSLTNYATSLIYYRDSRMNLYQNLKDQLLGLLNTNTALNNQISAFTTSVINFNANASSLNTLMTNSINGVSYTSNCTVVANHLRLIYNVVCANFIYKSVQLGICCLILLGIMVGGMLTGSVFGVRYNRIEKDPRAYLQQPPIVIEDEVSSSKKEDSSDTSSSEDE